MDDLPSDVLLNIFARLPDSTDLANCYLTSHRLLSLSYLISSISLQPNKCHNPVPFMTQVLNLASLLASSLRSLSITAKLDDNAISELNDLTDDNFLSAWLPLLGHSSSRSDSLTVGPNLVSVSPMHLLPSLIHIRPLSLLYFHFISSKYLYS